MWRSITRIIPKRFVEEAVATFDGISSTSYIIKDVYKVFLCAEGGLRRTMGLNGQLRRLNASSIDYVDKAYSFLVISE